MMIQRGFVTIKTFEDYLVGKTEDNKYIYVKIFNSKLELNNVRSFLSVNFTIDNENIFLKDTEKIIDQLVIICDSFQPNHVKEFMGISKHIQLICSGFFKINITKKAPLHQKVPSTLIKNKREIPIIKLSDPNCIFYNFQKGDVIRVVRSDGDICYRLVC